MESGHVRELQSGLGTLVVFSLDLDFAGRDALPPSISLISLISSVTLIILQFYQRNAVSWDSKRQRKARKSY